MDFRFLRVANSVILLTIFFLKKEINFRLYGCFRFWGEADVYFFECTVRVCVCVCVYSNDVLMHTVKIMNGRSANAWHFCMKTAIHRAVRKLSTPHCDDSSCYAEGFLLLQLLQITMLHNKVLNLNIRFIQLIDSKLILIYFTVCISQ